MTENNILSTSPEMTRKLAEDFAKNISGNAVLALHGELGSGKTCFVQGIAHALDIHQPVTSPTFTIINEYRGTSPLYHMDLYRMNSPDEVLALGFEEYVESDGVTAIEWPERAADVLPEQTVHIRFETTDNENERKITFSCVTREC
ncbi:tRNA (adenosine(37)-N6)-threonylcarbamoyltransferase complex ATPase subunit type 1 TsaE [bacterium B17]|nr:tRNA (adenosine(37)-N6)-threonylcarbamoyltransferase complex ATPase subunit type 1 TsaE [bacterium B17]